MRAALVPLVETLLYEGYALYPYTPEAVKSATLAPLGIVYPPAHARATPDGSDHLRLECLAVARIGVACSVEVHFLQARGTPREARARGILMPSLHLGGVAGRRTLEWLGADGEPTLKARLDVSSEPHGRGLWRIRVELHNETELPRDALAGSWDAFQHALLSTHVVVELAEGRFVSPLEPESRICQNHNIWPVLASPDDATMLGAAVVLPDHPALAPQSLGSLSDGTEIDEALQLHLQTLSQDERHAIAAQDAKVRAAIARAVAAEPTTSSDSTAS